MRRLFLSILEFLRFYSLNILGQKHVFWCIDQECDLGNYEDRSILDRVIPKTKKETDFLVYSKLTGKLISGPTLDINYTALSLHCYRRLGVM